MGMTERAVTISWRCSPQGAGSRRRWRNRPGRSHRDGALEHGGQPHRRQEKYADVEEEVKELLAEGYRIMEELKALVDKDAEVFEPLSKAYSLPKDTPRTGCAQGQSDGGVLH